MAKAAEATQEGDVAARWVSRSKLHVWADNPRFNDGTPVARVAASIRRFGWGAPMLARLSNGELVAGHTRWKAVDLLREQWASATDAERRDSSEWHPDAVRAVERNEVPVRYGEWNERDSHLLAIADNKLAELAEWNEPVVAELLSEQTLRDALLTGFTLSDLDEMAASIAGGSGAGEGETPAGRGGQQLDGLEYRIVIECDNEQQQAELIARFDAEGLRSKPLIS